MSNGYGTQTKPWDKNWKSGNQARSFRPTPKHWFQYHEWKNSITVTSKKTCGTHPSPSISVVLVSNINVKQWSATVNEVLHRKLPRDSTRYSLVLYIFCHIWRHVHHTCAVYGKSWFRSIVLGKALSLGCPRVVAQGTATAVCDHQYN